MKKQKTIIVAAILLVGFVLAAVAAGLYTTGWGLKTTATTTPVQTTGWVANSVSVYNSGTNTVFALVNCTTGVLASRITQGSAIPIPANLAYTFNAETKGQVMNLCYATTNATSEIFVGAF